jgi:hypothetical protein
MVAVKHAEETRHNIRAKQATPIKEVDIVLYRYRNRPELA